MARVHVIREARDGEIGSWQLCFQWCRYELEDGIQFGYRFVWRRPEDGSIQAARGQARLPSYEVVTSLMKKASDAGWGNRDGDKILEAASRLRARDLTVALASGYVGWPDRQAAEKGHLSQEQVNDATLIQEWSH